MSNKQILTIANELQKAGIEYTPAFVGQLLRIDCKPGDTDFESIIVPNISGTMEAIVTTNGDTSVTYWFMRHGLNSVRMTKRDWVSV
jgi:hypothetical protein